MPTPLDIGWIDTRIKERSEARRRKRLASIPKEAVLVDASEFSVQLSDLAKTLITMVDREGYKVLGENTLSSDIATILRQLRHTYNLLCFINADDTRFGHSGYQTSYSFRCASARAYHDRRLI